MIYFLVSLCLFCFFIILLFSINQEPNSVNYQISIQTEYHLTLFLEKTQIQQQNYYNKPVLECFLSHRGLSALFELWNSMLAAGRYYHHYSRVTDSPTQNMVWYLFWRRSICRAGVFIFLLSLSSLYGFAHFMFTYPGSQTYTIRYQLAYTVFTQVTNGLGPSQKAI